PSPLPPHSTLFPYTTLFRSKIPDQIVHCLLSPTLLLLRGRLSRARRGLALSTQSSSAPRTFPSAACGDGTFRDVLLRGSFIKKQDRKSTRLNSSHVSISYAV